MAKEGHSECHVKTYSEDREEDIRHIKVKKEFTRTVDELMCSQDTMLRDVLHVPEHVHLPKKEMMFYSDRMEK